MGVLRRSARVRAALLLAVALLATGASEAELKGAFVFRIARYVEWPRESASTGALRVAVVGEEPFAGILKPMIDGESLHGRRIEVKRVASSAEAAPCHILVVSGAPEPMGRILAAVDGAPVLTVGDHPDFARRGGMIGLVRDGPRIALEVNRRAIDDAGLRVSSQLLQIATLVDSKGS